MIRKAEARRIERYLGNATPDERQELLKITTSLDSVVGHDVYYSIVTGISYELLSNVNGVLTSKRNFYMLKDKSIEMFSDYLESQNKVAQSDKTD